jgi:glutamine synthetase
VITLEELTAATSHTGENAIDTVVLAVVDMQGRLQGKRFHARHFIDEVARAGSEGCNYLLAVDVEMNTVDGYAMSSWAGGYGDFAMVPDLTTLRRLPWHPGSALLLADLAWFDGTPVAASPRQILRRQLDRLAARGLCAYTGTELEFIVYRDSYEDAWRRGYRELTPANLYNVDYSLLGTARIEPLLRRIRREMAGAGLTPESAKGECNLGQHEIAFRYADALTCADHHAIYKNGAKEIAAQEGVALTFMAKPNAREGNSCHIHFSLRSLDGDRPVFATGSDGPPGPGEPTGHTGAPVGSDGAGHGHADGPPAHGTVGMSPLMRQALAGILATMPDFTLLYAPNINSYKRFQPDSFAPTALRWGTDNRTCALRVVGHTPAGLRLENRVPGGDVNPYLAIAAMTAGALYGIEHELTLEEPYAGNAYADADAPRVPATLRDAAGLWRASPIARDAFGAEVVEHYANAARVELAAFDAAVTDWELYRGFERL